MNFTMLSYSGRMSGAERQQRYRDSGKGRRRRVIPSAAMVEAQHRLAELRLAASPPAAALPATETTPAAPPAALLAHPPLPGDWAVE